MTGPEHYHLAEELLNEVGCNPIEKMAAVLAEAQVHATLALVAAMAGQKGAAGMTNADDRAWSAVVSRPDSPYSPLGGTA